MCEQTIRADEPTAKFPFGQIVATPNALNQIPNEEVLSALSRHAQGDWGTMDLEDLVANERALAKGGRLFSSYKSLSGIPFCILIQYDPSAPPILLPQPS